MPNKKHNFISAIIAVSILPLVSYANDPFAELDAETNSSFNNPSAQWQQKRAADGFADMEREMQRFNRASQPAVQPPPVQKPQVVERIQPAPQPIVIVIPERVREPARVQAPAAVPQPVISAKTPPPAKTPSGKQTIRIRDYVFQLNGCEKSGSDVSCDLTVTSQKRDKVLNLYRKTRLFDNLGNEYWPISMQIANSHKNSRWHSPISKQLISGVPTKVNVTFRDVSDDATSIPKFNIHANSQSSYFNISFRNFDLM